MPDKFQRILSAEKMERQNCQTQNRSDQGSQTGTAHADPAAQHNGHGNIDTHLRRIGKIADQLVSVSIHHVDEKRVHGIQQHEKLIISVIRPCVGHHGFRGIHEGKIAIFPKKRRKKQCDAGGEGEDDSLPKQPVRSVLLKFSNFIGIQHGGSDAD